MNASSTPRTVTVVTSALGGLILVGLTASAALAVASGATGTSDEPSTLTSSARGVSSLEIDTSASDFELRFDDVPEARLEVVGDTRYRWEMETRGDELVVTNRQRFWDFCIGWCNAGPEQVTLTLPEELNDGELDAVLGIAAGSLRADADFRDLALDMSAGSAEIEGSARSLLLDLSAGKADLRLDSVRETAFDVSAGRAVAALTGDAPRRTAIDLSAGHLDLTLPDAVYAVQSDVSAGDLANGLRTEAGSSRSVDVDLSAGSVVLRPGD